MHSVGRTRWGRASNGFEMSAHARPRAAARSIAQMSTSSLKISQQINAVSMWHPFGNGLPAWTQVRALADNELFQSGNKRLFPHTTRNATPRHYDGETTDLSCKFFPHPHDACPTLGWGEQENGDGDPLPAATSCAGLLEFWKFARRQKGQNFKGHPRICAVTGQADNAGPVGTRDAP